MPKRCWPRWRRDGIQAVSDAVRLTGCIDLALKSRTLSPFRKKAEL